MLHILPLQCNGGLLHLQVSLQKNTFQSAYFYSPIV